MNDDMELVRLYAVSQSEQAFETLVNRYVNLVYSAAVRQVSDPQWAQEIAQVVFIILARKAGGLGPRTILPSWLYRTARYVAADAVKAERRRKQREHEAHMQTLNETANEIAPEEIWAQIAPLLDGAMNRLGEKDHAALVLRFFENRDFAEVGAALGATEDAAKMRVGRALEKLRKFFTKQGVNSTTAMIAGTISANSVGTAPMTLAKTVSVAAIAKGTASSASTLTLMKGALKLMAWTKAKTAVIAGIVILATAGTATVAIRHVEHQRVLVVANPFSQQPDPKSGAGLSMAAAKFVTALCKQGQLPGFPEGKTYVRKGNSDPGLIQVQIPGIRISRAGVLLSADTNLETYPVSRTLVASKNNNGHFDYHFSVTKLSETDDWRLTRAWREGTNGTIAEEYSVP